MSISVAPDLTRRPLPSSDEAERAILAAILMDQRLIWQARQLLRPEWFASEANRTWYDVFVNLVDTGRSIDEVTVVDELNRRGLAERMRGIAGLSELITGYGRLENIDAYARRVKDAALLRAMIRFGDLTQGDAAGYVLEPSEVLRKAQIRLSKIAAAAVSDVDDSAAGVADRFHAKFENPDSRRGMPTGFRKLDYLTAGGLWPGDLWYLAAYTSTGKTAFATAVAFNLANAGYHVDLLSYEMPPEQLAARLYSSIFSIDLGRLRLGRLYAEELERYDAAREWMASAPLRIVNAAGMTTADIRSRAHRLKAEGCLDAMVTDYIGRIPSAARHASRAAEVAAISRELAEIGTELEVANLCLVQINREAAKSDAEPELWWLRDSGGQENDADAVMFLVREKDAEHGTLYVKKQRNGPLGEIPINFEHAYARYTEGL